MLKAYKRPKLPHLSKLWWLVGGLIAVIVCGIVIAAQVYANGLKPVSNSQQTQIFTVDKGSSLKVIAVSLEEARLIRSAWAFQLYVHFRQQGDNLQAGTYALSPSAGTGSIVNTLTKGKVTAKLVTILPGRRIDQVRADMINAGFVPAAVDKALDPSLYADLPVLAFKPPDVNSLEGLLWPDSYQKQPDTEAAVIIRQSLEAMGRRLTADVQAAFAAKGLNPYQGLTLASMVLQEVGRADDQAQVAQVFLARFSGGRPLESDATARYGAILAGLPPSVDYDSVYNTYNHAGLPPTPISTINTTSLAAVTNPAATSWLYFVSGDDGTTYFSTNLEEHEALTRKHCHRLCGN